MLAESGAELEQCRRGMRYKGKLQVLEKGWEN